jgi:outer membrane protein assembly factor BamA
MRSRGRMTEMECQIGTRTNGVGRSGCPAPCGLHAVLLAAVLACAPGILSAQVTGPTPLVQDITFEGADALPASGLESRIATRQTRCRALLFRPFCLISDGSLFTERHRLDPAELTRDELRLRVVYFREGFRQAAVSSEVLENGDGVEVRFRLEEGPPTVIETVEVYQARDILSERDLEVAGLPRAGGPLNLDALTGAMEALLEELAERGHLDARIEDEIEVSADGQRADLRLEIDAGPRATVRQIEILGTQEIEDPTILLALHLGEEDVITTSLLRRSRNALHQSGLFHEANVTVADPSADSPDGVPDSAKVVTVQVREAPPRLSRVGGGFSTLEFGQLEGRFTHYNWMGGGRRLDLRAGLGNLFASRLTGFGLFHDILPGELSEVAEGPFRQPTWQVSADFQQPAFRAASNTLALGVFSHRRVTPGVSVDRGVGAEVSLIRSLAFRAPLSLTYRYEVTSVEAGGVYFCVNHGICELSAVESLRGRNSLSPISLGFQIDRSDDPLGPTTGYRARLDFEHASAATLSDFRYNRVSGEVSWYQPIAGPPSHVLAVRARAGWVRPIESTSEALGIGATGEALLHPRKRFFAGGARSVRGFSENQLGPRILTIPRQNLLEEDRCTAEEIDDRSCDPSLTPVEEYSPRPIGGTSILEGSVEYRIPVGPATFALFVDGALVGARLGEFLQDAPGAITPGIGARFPSPAGPIRIDLGFHPRAVTALPVVTEAGSPEEGPGELVQLDARRRFDRPEGEGTMAAVLSRLTLHFSIGEAF